jgi:MFS family permease
VEFQVFDFHVGVVSRALSPAGAALRIANALLALLVLFPLRLADDERAAPHGFGFVKLVVCQQNSPQKEISRTPIVTQSPRPAGATLEWLAQIQHTFRALRHRDFRLYVIGQIISLTGSTMQSVALSWLVYRLSGSTLLMGTVVFATQAPILFIGPLGGLAADRYSRLRITMLMQAGLLVHALILAALTIAGVISVNQIIALAILAGMLNAFEVPARQALYIHMVGPDDLANAITLNSMTFNAARVIGPTIGGIAVAWFGEGPCFVVNAISFLAVLLSFFMMRLPEPARPAAPRALAHLREGFAYAWNHRPVLALLVLTAVTNLCSAPSWVLGPIFADAIFQKGSEGFGLLNGMFGMGAVAGTLVLARSGQALQLPRVVLISATSIGAALVVYAGAPSFGFVLASMLFLGFSVMRQLASSNTMIQSLIDDSYRGRVMALYTMTVLGMFSLGNMAGGAVAEWIGPRWTVLAGAICMFAAAAGYRLIRKEIEHALAKGGTGS